MTMSDDELRRLSAARLGGFSLERCLRDCPAFTSIQHSINEQHRIALARMAQNDMARFVRDCIEERGDE